MKVEPEALAELNHHLPTVQRKSPSAQHRNLSDDGTQFLEKKTGICAERLWIADESVGTSAIASGSG